jgi:hypothetical protein
MAPEGRAGAGVVAGTGDAKDPFDWERIELIARAPESQHTPNDNLSDETQLN